MFQNATYNPGASGDRWMGSIAMDKFGNMLMGYSVANVGTGLKPFIAFAGRLNGDAVNTLQTEIIDTTGTGSQTTYGPPTTPLTRWGDYSTMQIDPAESLQRFWTLTETNDLATDLTFNYPDPTDIAGTEASYKLYGFTGGTGTAVTPFKLNAGANTISTTGISSFSDWAVGNLAAPTTTAAAVTIGGRVLTANGKPIARNCKYG